MQLKVLIHEYAHSLAYKHLENNNCDYREHRNQYETEAESITYSVAKHSGLNTNDYSLNYLYSWSKNKDFKELDDSFDTIVNYSKIIINNFEKFYNRDLDYQITKRVVLVCETFKIKMKIDKIWGHRYITIFLDK